MAEYDIADSHRGMAESLCDIRPVAISTYSALAHAIDERYITTRPNEAINPEREVREQVPLTPYNYKTRVDKAKQRTFYVKDGQGVRLDRGAQENYGKLNGACEFPEGEHIFDGMGDAMRASLQIHWPNLDQPWHIQIRIRNETRERRLFDAKKTIHEICKGIDKIYQDNQGNMRPPVEWRLGPEGIQLKDLYLDAVKTIPPSKSFEVELSVRRIQVKADA